MPMWMSLTGSKSSSPVAHAPIGVAHADLRTRDRIDAHRVDEATDQLGHRQRQDRLLVGHRRRVVDHEEQIDLHRLGVLRRGRRHAGRRSRTRATCATCATCATRAGSSACATTAIDAVACARCSRAAMATHRWKRLRSRRHCLQTTTLEACITIGSARALRSRRRRFGATARYEREAAGDPGS